MSGTVAAAGRGATDVRVLVTGASGYIGGLLVPRLLARGHDVRCLVRDPARLPARWRDRVEVVTGSVGEAQAVLRAADGVEVAVYLVHGLSDALEGLVRRETAMAAAFRDGVELAGVGRIVYLGGLVEEDALITTSEHLYARQQTGQTLRDGPVPVTELRAGIVLGAASASFVLLRRAAGQRVHVKTPWASSRCQPIAQDDVLSLLVAAVEAAGVRDEVLDVGGPDVLTYDELVGLVRAESGAGPARRVSVPWLPPEAVALAAAARWGTDPAVTLALLSSARVDAVVRDGGAAERRFPGLATTPAATAIRRALDEPPGDG